MTGKGEEGRNNVRSVVFCVCSRQEEKKEAGEGSKKDVEKMPNKSKAIEGREREK